MSLRTSGSGLPSISLHRDGPPALSLHSSSLSGLSGWTPKKLSWPHRDNRAHVWQPDAEDLPKCNDIISTVAASSVQQVGLRSTKLPRRVPESTQEGLTCMFTFSKHLSSCFLCKFQHFLCIKVKQNKARVTPACVLWCKENSRDVKAFFSEKFHLAEFLFFGVNGVKNTDEQLFKHRAAAKQARPFSESDKRRVKSSQISLELTRTETAEMCVRVCAAVALLVFFPGSLALDLLRATATSGGEYEWGWRDPPSSL